MPPSSIGTLAKVHACALPPWQPCMQLLVSVHTRGLILTSSSSHTPPLMSCQLPTFSCFDAATSSESWVQEMFPLLLPTFGYYGRSDPHRRVKLTVSPSSITHSPLIGSETAHSSAACLGMHFAEAAVTSSWVSQKGWVTSHLCEPALPLTQ